MERVLRMPSAEAAALSGKLPYGPLRRWQKSKDPDQDTDQRRAEQIEAKEFHQQRLQRELQQMQAQMQALQAVSLVGRGVSVPGNQIQVVKGAAEGSYELDGAAQNVKLEILGAAGNVIDTQQLGAQAQGRQTFSWKAGTLVSEGSELKYRITATNGSAPVKSTTYAYDKVSAVYSGNGSVMLKLDRLGAVDYTAVSAVN
ncbi:MAG: hypothetical protein IIA03_04570 [Proteobacteria bacterium]|nr:hypothetical protein [Pseudomonadota bacterium]